MSTDRTADLAAAVEELRDRVRHLEDIEALRNLKAEYAAACDDNYDPDRLAALFVEDATWESQGLGRHEGREAIREFFRGISGHFVFALHYGLNPHIEVTGDTARGSVVLVHAVHRGGHRKGDVAGRSRRRGIRAGPRQVDVPEQEVGPLLPHDLRGGLGKAAVHLTGHASFHLGMVAAARYFGTVARYNPVLSRISFGTHQYWVPLIGVALGFRFRASL